MKKINFQTVADFIGLSGEAATLPVENTDDYEIQDGATFMAVDTGKIYILYNKKWYPI